MMKFRQNLLAGIGVLALSATPALAGNALPQEGAGTTGTAPNSMDSSGMDSPAANAGAMGGAGMTTGSITASAPENVEDRGYRNIEPARRANVPAGQLAFNAVDPVGNPVLLIVDRSTGRVLREKEMHTLPTPSKNQ